jgi:hypothetical protein
MLQFRPIVNQSQNEQVRQLWRMAETEQATSESYLAKERYHLAAKFTFAARQHGRAALTIIRRQASPERIQCELDRTDALIVRAREPVKSSGNEQAQALFDRALDWQNQARVAFREKRFLPCVKLGLAARDLLLRAWETARGSAGPELLGRALAETDELIREWADAIRQSSNDQARTLLDQALPHQDAAKEHERGQRYLAALTETGIARRLLRRAIELVESE